MGQVLETNRAEESHCHVHRMYFMGPNTFSEPWHLPHTPPEQISEIVYVCPSSFRVLSIFYLFLSCIQVLPDPWMSSRLFFFRYEDAFNKFVDEINTLAAYQWWEGSVYSILCILSYPLAWSWQQWRRRKKLQKLREFVRSEYDHSCLRSCRSRALYEGLKACIYCFLLYLPIFSNISIHGCMADLGFEPRVGPIKISTCLMRKCQPARPVLCFELKSELLTTWWAKLQGSSGPTWTTLWVCHCALRLKKLQLCGCALRAT
jgi:hypothetical protein